MINNNELLIKQNDDYQHFNCGCSNRFSKKIKTIFRPYSETCYCSFLLKNLILRYVKFNKCLMRPLSNEKEKMGEE